MDKERKIINIRCSILNRKGDILLTYAPFRNIIDEKKVETLNDEISNSLSDFLVKDYLTELSDIEVLPSYDGSVNLIISDNNNSPKLINSRFSVRDNNTYEIVDRLGTSDTNLYNSDKVNIQTNLQLTYTTISTVDLKKIDNFGNMNVGNYTFYFTYADADENETDFFAESGIVSCFCGNDGDPFSIDGKNSDYNSHKAITLLLHNLDTLYTYIKVYFSRNTSDLFSVLSQSAFKIDYNFPLLSKDLEIRITGDEGMTLIPLDALNIKYFMADRAKTLAICNNRLFLANIRKQEVDYSLLQDIGLKFVASIKDNTLDSISNLSYTKNSNYYSTKNIYNKVGYHNEELYRFGIVYIFNNNELSPVFNIRGIDLNNTYTSYSNLPKTKDEYSGDEYIIIPKDGFFNKVTLENPYGVVRINKNNNSNYLFGIDISLLDLGSEALNTDFKEKVYSALLKQNISGFFFVRQKRIPTILALVGILPMDASGRIPLNKSGQTLSPIEAKDKKLKIKATTVSGNLDSLCYCGISGEIELLKPYFNNLFTGTEYKLKKEGESNFINCRLVSVPEASNGVAVNDNGKNYIFRSQAGEAADPLKCVGPSFDNRHGEYPLSTYIRNGDCNFYRGLFGPYLGIYNKNENSLKAGEVYNIYIQDYSTLNMLDYFKIRMEDKSPFRAISQRYSIDLLKENNIPTCYRGDSYYGLYTLRILRNFLDPESPNNDLMVDPNSIDSWQSDKPDSILKVNRGDMNAATLGVWETFPLRSSINLSIRSTDPNYPEEKGLTGHPRVFYPLYSKSTEGNYKIPESVIYNTGFKQSMGERWNYEVPNVPYLQNVFENRIIYSDLAISGGFANGYRVFNLKHYRDWNTSYGGITKILEFRGQLAVIFEHGISINPVGGGTKENSSGEFLNTDNVLPFNPNIISDTLGSTWKDSIIKTSKAVYGVDTIAKKIWKFDGTTVLAISDMKVLKFLNDNLQLSEMDKYPEYALKNVKTHYNANKGDIMFTFYNANSTYLKTAKDNNLVLWNLCYNEDFEIFTTFYSWIPIISSNINNIFFSFDRDESKYNRLDNLDGTIKYYNKDGRITIPDLDYTTNIVSLTNMKGILTLFDTDYGPNTTEFTILNLPINRYLTSNSNDSDITIADLLDNEEEKFRIKDSSGKTRVIAKTLPVTYNNLVTAYSNNIIDSRLNNLKTSEKIRDVLYYSCVISDELCLKTFSETGIPKETTTVNNKVIQAAVNEINNIDFIKPINFKIHGRAIINEDERVIEDATIYLGFYNTATNKADFLHDRFGLYNSINSKPFYLEEENFGYLMFSRIDNLDNDWSEPGEYRFKADGSGYFKIEGFELVENLRLEVTVYTTELDTIKFTGLYIQDGEGNEVFNNGTEHDKSFTSQVITSFNKNYTLPVKYEDGLRFLLYKDSLNQVLKRYLVNTSDVHIWQHGNAGIFDEKLKILPTHWYGKLHPFEFEFTIKEDIAYHKIFNNLMIIGNNAEPESFHFLIIGDCYDFAKDKPNMYFRQEATKALYQYNGSDIDYDKDIEYNDTLLNGHKLWELSPNECSTILPCAYYARQHTYDNIQDFYRAYLKMGYNYVNLSGSEITKLDDEYAITTHAMAVDLKDVGILRGNMRYKEDRWFVLINPITLVQKNEDKRIWASYTENEDGTITGFPPIVLGNNPIPDDMELTSINDNNVPEFLKEKPESLEEDKGYGYYGYSIENGSINIDNWGNTLTPSSHSRSEAKIKDKYIRIKVRYSGKKHVVIQLILTYYTNFAR